MVNLTKVSTWASTSTVFSRVSHSNSDMALKTHAVIQML